MHAALQQALLGPDPYEKDWSCPRCEEENRGGTVTCRRCGGPRPAPEATPVPPASAQAPGGSATGVLALLQGTTPQGDWICPVCRDTVYRAQLNCRRCGAQRPEGVCTQPGGLQALPPGVTSLEGVVGMVAPDAILAPSSWSSQWDSVPAQVGATGAVTMQEWAANIDAVEKMRKREDGGEGSGSESDSSASPPRKKQKTTAKETEEDQQLARKRELIKQRRIRHKVEEEQAKAKKEEQQQKKAAPDATTPAAVAPQPKAKALPLL
eukprot:CAMPEP_0178390510 /NCGR_PEP_ID=MMETSP0689_2-20121128/10684_1 /TAXON_ID=160604 /ORGANISM="Amphidinium massartii, Strain CS-259" /LENGTH=265 /DNA_ID=CAMNT_0020011023 /DNA_START=135 /DNA_END=929 /DNA_ORIENTATION=+